MLEFLKSTVGRKYIMGLTGLIWVGFILTHMAANMLILFSADLFNAYGHAITSNKLVLYGAESVLVAALIVHIICAISLTRSNRSARETRYAVKANGKKAASFASQWMGVQGSIILVFIIMHLITFKYGADYQTVVNGVPMRDLHRLVLEIFQIPAYVVGYLISLVILFFHLSHGAQSVFQSFGFLERKMQAGIKKLAFVYAIVVVAGFLSQPLYVFLIYKK